MENILLLTLALQIVIYSGNRQFEIDLNLADAKGVVKMTLGDGEEKVVLKVNTDEGFINDGIMAFTNTFFFKKIVIFCLPKDNLLFYDMVILVQKKSMTYNKVDRITPL